MDETSRRASRSILVAEDDRGIRRLLALILRDDRRSILLAGDGDEALALARRHPIDLLLVDVHMPRMGGATVCQEYRRCGGAAPVVLLSAASDGAEAARACAADAFIAKPFEIATLLETVERYAGARRAECPGHASAPPSGDGGALAHRSGYARASSRSVSSRSTRFESG